MCKSNVFLNFINNQQGRHVVIQMVGGRIIEGKAVMLNMSDDIATQPFIEEKDGVLVQPMYDAHIALVWPKYHSKWMDAEEFGDNAFFDLDGSKQMAFINSCNDWEDDFYAEEL